HTRKHQDQANSHQKNGIKSKHGTLLSSQTTGPAGTSSEFHSGYLPAERGSTLPGHPAARKSAFRSNSKAEFYPDHPIFSSA
ncbi:hypothetical protein, partial [Sinomonas sp. G460-2]|uniref:hypothetical protein n=1 Tax=Sinomonas sp. G460-2 TaxID=3393464 RepID=UPI0039F012E5